jgi:ABC-type uncharacterized transport system ATPase subunit
VTEPLLLEVCSLSRTFGPLRALDGVNLSVRSGTFHGLIGPNGSGKSTLLNVIAGRHVPDTGSVMFDKRDITASTPYERARAGLSVKFQITTVIGLLSVYDNILLALQARQNPWSLMRSLTRHALHVEVTAMLEHFRLLHRADDLAGELSHGEQQWLEIAMALASNPKLLLLDEPTGGMSPEERRVTGELLKPIKAHCTLVIVEHDLDFIRAICDQLTVLDQGRVLDSGTVEDIQRSAKVQEVYTSRA